jgi:hypothetical protein
VSNTGVQMEQIVRPSAAAPIRPAYPTALLASITPDENAKTWGSSGNSIFDLKAHFESTVKPATWPEEDRMFDEVKVSSKEDSSTSITVEAMTQFKAKDPKTGKFAPVQASDNVEIVSRNNTRTSNLA